MTTIYTVLLMMSQPLSEPLSPLNIEKQALLARQRIRSGKIEFTVQSKTPPKRVPVAIGRQTVWFDLDQQKIRLDQQIIPRPGATAYRRIQCNNCEQEGMYFAHDELESKDSIHAAIFQPMKGRSQVRFDPRIIGILPYQPNVLDNYSIESIWLKPNRKQLNAHRETIEGKEFAVVTFVDEKDARYTMWYAPEMDYALTRLRGTIVTKGETYTVEVNNTHKKFGDVYFPEKSVFSEQSSGSPEVEEITTTIHHAELNTKQADHLFTFAGMGLNPKTYIRTQSATNAKMQVWDGTSLEEYQNKVKEFPRYPASQNLYSYSTVAMAGLLGVLALGAIVVFFRWRTRPTT
jgi:hypothetical protein